MSKFALYIWCEDCRSRGDTEGCFGGSRVFVRHFDNFVDADDWGFNNFDTPYEYEVLKV